MALLSTAFREAVKKSKDISQINEMQISVSYPTGFLNFDFANGYIQQTYGGELNYQVGLTDGSINMVISDSGLGKTTWVTQVASNIVRRYPTACCFYDQAEVGTNIQRIWNLSGFKYEEEFGNKFIIRDAGITTESVYDRVKQIHDLKVDNSDTYLYDTGLLDLRGNPVFKFEPTMYVVDSIKMVMSRKNAEADESTNMTGATNAKVNSEYYTKMVPLCREAGITMILINHITQDINTGFLPKKSELPYLKQGEHLPGGKTLTYIMNNIIRLDIKSKLKETEAFGFLGSTVNVDIVKSRSNKSARALTTMVFNPMTGYDNDLSLLLMLKDNGILEGSGAYLRLPGIDKKFSMREFKSIIHEDPNFYSAFARISVDFLKQKLLDEYNQAKAIEQASEISPYEALLAELTL